MGLPPIGAATKHHTLGTTPAVAAGLEEKAWDLEQVVEMTQAYWLKKRG